VPETKIVYVVEALRWGDRENHSYVVGVYSDFSLAKSAADAHSEYRGGKYECQVHQSEIDKEIDSDWNKTLLYQTKSIYEIDSDSLRVRNVLHVLSKNTKVVK